MKKTIIIIMLGLSLSATGQTNTQGIKSLKSQKNQFNKHLVLIEKKLHQKVITKAEFRKIELALLFIINKAKGQDLETAYCLWENRDCHTLIINY